MSLNPLPALNQLAYDESTYRQTLKQSMFPGEYVLAQYSTTNCDRCVHPDAAAAPAIGSGSVPSCGNGFSEVDVESELRNITRPATRDPAGKYRGAGGPPTVCGGVPMHHGATVLGDVPTCRMPPSVDSRMTTPSCTLRGTGWNRFEWLCQDPQAHALMPFDSLINTSIVMKDNHRPHLARPIDPTLALPPSASRCVKPINAMSIPCNAQGGLGVGPDGEPPILSFRTCQEIDRSRYGCRG